MASNIDSGVDTSNDSENNFINSQPQLPNVEQFAIPKFQPPVFASFSSSASSSSSTLPSSSSTLKMKIRGKVRFKSTAISNVLQISRERKLRLAASTCNVELLTKLLELKVDPNCSDQHKRSPLHMAAARGYEDIVLQLLKHGANPNIVDSLGNTPLHLAVISASSKNFNRVVLVLLQHGANVLILDRANKSPLQLAEAKLRLMRSRYVNPTWETLEIIDDMCVLVKSILRRYYIQKKHINNLNALDTRLQNLSTNDTTDIADSLLESIEKLSITTSSETTTTTTNDST